MPFLKFQIAILFQGVDVEHAFMSIPPFPLLRAMRTLGVSLTLVTIAGAQSLLAPTPVSLEDLSAFKAPGPNWQLAGGLGGNPRSEKTLSPLPGHGILVNNPTSAARTNLFTAWEHGDAEIDLDFLLTPGSNSGVYLMGRYEVQLRDSWGVKTPGPGDCGGIYRRWDDARGKGNEEFEGSAPLANASRAPGLWQHLHIKFQAPRFDASGKKTANARFVQVVLNDFVIQENVELTGPTRSAAFAAEALLGPLMIQGDHGAVAIKAIAVKQFDPAAPRVQVDDLAYKFYPADPKQTELYDSVPPLREGKLEKFAADAVEKNGKFTAVFTGTLVVPRDGSYSFTADSYEPIALVIDGQAAIQRYNRGGQPVALNLTAGRHPFRLNYTHSSNGTPGFELFAEGPGLARHALTAPVETRKDDNRPRTLIIEPVSNRVRLQRSFVPFDPKKRLYAINVGTPAGIHYAYDFETGALLRAWRGEFLDTFEMWDGRGENQLGKPAGPALTLTDKPVLALMERYTNDWPDQADALWSSQGYQLAPDGQPTFFFKLASLSATDRIAPAADGRGLTRTLLITGRTTSWESWVLLAEADRITPQTNGRSYLIGDRDYYLDLPEGATIKPLLRTRNGRQQLVVPINATTLGQPLIYSLVW